MLLKEIKIIFHKELDIIYGKEEVDSFFYLFLEHYLGLERFVLALQPNYTITKEEEQLFFEGLARLKSNEPVQHILGKAYFMDLELMVNKNVLIPRPETEELVEWVISEIGNQDSQVRILDIGTGSGCIAVALAKALPKAKIYALDIAGDALQIARENAALNKVAIEFIHADVLNFDMEAEQNPDLDIIVSNPPYVRELEITEMHNNVTQYEPSAALFVPNEDPLRFYRAIISLAKKRLKSGGNLYFEINQYLSAETEALLVDNDFGQVELRKDIFGNFRMLKGVKS